MQYTGLSFTLLGLIAQGSYAQTTTGTFEPFTVQGITEDPSIASRTSVTNAAGSLLSELSVTRSLPPFSVGSGLTVVSAGPDGIIVDGTAPASYTSTGAHIAYTVDGGGTQQGVTTGAAATSTGGASAVTAVGHMALGAGVAGVAALAAAL